MVREKRKNLGILLSQPKWIFLLVRVIILMSLIFGMLSEGFDQQMWLLLGFFFTYSFFALLLIKRIRKAAEKLYLLVGFLDVISITLAGWTTDGGKDGFYFLYFLVVPFGSYIAGLIPGLCLAFLSSLSHLIVQRANPAAFSISSILLKTLPLWALAFVVSVVVKEMKFSRSKLLRTFDILNQRTSELEKSQAQIETIYETSRTLVEKLNINEVVEEILNIVQKIIGYQFFSIFLLTDQQTLSLLGEIKNGRRITNREPKVFRPGGALSSVVRNAKLIRVFNADEESHWEMNQQGVKSFMAVPLISRGNVIGVMNARSTRTGAFLDQDEKIFSILAGSAALAIENAQLHQKTQELTIVDDLTGLFNYRYFSRKFSGEIMRAERYQLPLSLIMIDIDWFKRCNDTYGHLFGNMVLRDLAKRTRESVREVDVVCRYGGEEFAVILPQTKKEDARMIGERIRQRVESADFASEAQESRVRITVSLGVASFPENGRTSEELIEKVDQALYLAKGRGKNSVCTV